MQYFSSAVSCRWAWPSRQPSSGWLQRAGSCSRAAASHSRAALARLIRRQARLQQQQSQSEQQRTQQQPQLFRRVTQKVLQMRASPLAQRGLPTALWMCLQKEPRHTGSLQRQAKILWAKNRSVGLTVQRRLPGMACWTQTGAHPHFASALPHAGHHVPGSSHCLA